MSLDLLTELINCKEENKLLKEKLTRYEKAFEILKDKLEFENLGEMQNGVMFRGYFEDCFSEEEYELLEDVMDNENTK